MLIPVVSAVLMLVFAGPADAAGSDCDRDRPFLAVVGEADLVVIGEVSPTMSFRHEERGEYVYSALDVTLKEVLHGDEDATALTVWATREEVSRYAHFNDFWISTHWVLALKRGSADWGFEDEVGEVHYRLSACGQFSLMFDDGFMSPGGRDAVSGAIEQPRAIADMNGTDLHLHEYMPMQEFRERLNTAIKARAD